MNSNNYSWDQIRTQIRQFRTTLQTIYPMQVLAMIKDFTVSSNSLYFLSNNSNSTDTTPARNMQIYQIDLDQMDQIEFSNADEKSNRDYLIAISNIPVLKRKTLFTEYIETDDNNLFRQLQLQGVHSFQILDNVLLFTFQNSLFIAEIGKIPRLIPCPKESNRMDPKLGGTFNDLIAFIRNRDIWVTNFDGHDTQLTFCSLSPDPTLKCGIAEYMMQEEFHRFTGYYWLPNKKHRTNESILYLETSEFDVEQVFISKSSPNDDSNKESIRYPRAGQPNAKSEIKIVEFTIDDKGYPANIVHKKLWRENDIRIQFPWMEYIVRFGWLPDGESIWLQILSRDQKRTAVIKLSLSQFTTCADNGPSTTEILWEESNSAWINVTDVYYFMQSSCVDHAKFIWSSEKSNGYRHLYLIEKKREEQHPRITQLTKGDWCCVDRPLYVDEARSMVYFSAKLHSPLETHFYVISYKDMDEPKLLTKLGFSHTVTMNSPDYFVDCFSTLHDPQVITVQKLNQPSNRTAPLMPIALKRNLETPPSPPFLSQSFKNTLLHKHNDNIDSNGEIFSFHTLDGAQLYGCLYKPRCYEPGQSYPTILHIYGGPKTQLIANEFKFPRLVRYLMSVYFGFAVVVIDSRGSSDRGLKFESHIQNSLGTVELKDQLEGLQFVNDTQFGAVPTEDGQKKSVVDLNRLAITGWSYGGYLSLMGLAQYPDKFKMAIAGAPVTQWELYDAAYTERYMGYPNENPGAYQASNVLSYIHKFPDEENRLLVAHGLLDENVHFQNTEKLVSQLVKYKKPHYLQVYPSEKHGLRHASVNEHFEILMFYWLTNYL